MQTLAENFGYGKDWRLFHTDVYEGYRPNMAHFHWHDYYEISLILSGDVRVLLPGETHEGKGARLLLTAPGTPHFVSCMGEVLYRRINLLFSPELTDGAGSEERGLLSLFGKAGTVLTLPPEKVADFLALAEKMEKETAPLRWRLLLFYFLSLAGELRSVTGVAERPPAYISDALAFCEEHYAEKCTAEQLATRLHVGRTTLLVGFRKYTGYTLLDYRNRCRLRRALPMLRAGESLQGAAEQCGFGEAGNLIRAFRRVYHTTPREFLNHLR